MTWEYVSLDPAPLAGAQALVGLPTGDPLGPVATGLLVDHLGMRLAGGFHSAALPPVAVVRGGRVSSPVQAWVSEAACGPDGRCDRLVVVRSDVPVPPEALFGLADAVARWAAEHRLALVVALEAYASKEDPGRGVLAAASLSADPGLTKQLGATPLQQGIIAGFGGLLLLRANLHRVPALCLFAPAAEGAVAATAVELLRRVDPLLPNIALSPAELGKRAEALEARLVEERAATERAAARNEGQVDRSYA